MSNSPLPASDAPALHIRFDEAVPVLEIPPALPFEELRTWVREVVPEYLRDIGGRTCRLDFAERELQLFDLRRLIHLLRDEFDIEITGLYVRQEAIQRYAERELKLKLFLADDAPPASFELPLHPESTDEETAMDEPEAEDALEESTEVGDDSGDDALDQITLPTDLTAADLDPDAVAAEARTLDDLACEAPRKSVQDHGRRTFTIHRTLRSGSVVRFDGDLIVFSDVNPGAQVIATGNVIVLGALKGMAHAGAEGDESSNILAFDFRPTQVRIGKKIAMPPRTRSDRPELVTVRDGEIVIEPYQGRL